MRFLFHGEEGHSSGMLAQMRAMLASHGEPVPPLPSAEEPPRCLVNRCRRGLRCALATSPWP
jgi:hypothetical protein